MKVINTKISGLLFNRGNFGKQKLIIKPVSIMGNIVTDTYINIYVQQSGGTLSMYTTRIRTVFLYIKKVELKGNGIFVVLK